jgi:hypothetical protein
MFEQINNALLFIGFISVISWLGKKTFEGFKNAGLKEVKITFESNKDSINGQINPLTVKNNARRRQLTGKSPRTKSK